MTQKKQLSQEDWRFIEEISTQAYIRVVPNMVRLMIPLLHCTGSSLEFEKAVSFPPHWKLLLVETILHPNENRNFVCLAFRID